MNHEDCGFWSIYMEHLRWFLVIRSLFLEVGGYVLKGFTVKHVMVLMIYLVQIESDIENFS